MADFLVLTTAIASGPSGPEVLKEGRIISDDVFTIADLKAQGVAVIAFVPGAMAGPRDAFNRSSRPSTLISLLLADGAI